MNVMHVPVLGGFNISPLVAKKSDGFAQPFFVTEKGDIHPNPVL